jgi:D-lactate dehydrogenase (cytochrome)
MISDVIEALRGILGDRVSTSDAVREHHSHGESWHAPGLPDVVVFPTSTEEVSEIVKVCAGHRLPIVPFGMGSSLEGHVNAIHGGVSIDLTRMTRVLRLSPEDLDITVEAGLTRLKLDAHLKNTGLMFPIDPGADATIGGMAATRASGTNAMRYGTMRETVISLKAVMANGDVVSTGGRARKSAAGLDLTRLLVGSEGTLGLITELTLKLHPIPARIIAAACPFATLAGACEAVIEANETGLVLARVELLDALQMRAINAYSKLAMDEAPHLFIEISGGEAAADEQLAIFRAIALRHGALRFDWAADETERARLWRARHDAYWAVQAMWPGKTLSASDVCVPVSRLAECVAETVADFDAAGLIAPVVGHVGDGNFHVIPVVDAADSEAMARARDALDRLVDRALAMGGTSTGEHGVGQGKMAYLEREFGPGAVAAMGAVKKALDPLGIFNPGKMIEAF